MRFDRTQIHEGMTVHSSDGEKLGKVVTCDASVFVIEKGFFFRKDYIARYDDVRSVEGDEVRLTMSQEAFEDLRLRPEATPARTMLGPEDGAFQPGSFPVAHAGLPEAGTLSARSEDDEDERARTRSEDEDELARTRRVSEPEEGSSIAGIPREVAHDALTGEWKGRHIGE